MLKSYKSLQDVPQLSLAKAFTVNMSNKYGVDLTLTSVVEKLQTPRIGVAYNPTDNNVDALFTLVKLRKPLFKKAAQDLLQSFAEVYDEDDVISAQDMGFEGIEAGTLKFDFTQYDDLYTTTASSSAQRKAYIIPETLKPRAIYRITRTADARCQPHTGLIEYITDDRQYMLVTVLDDATLQPKLAQTDLPLRKMVGANNFHRAEFYEVQVEAEAEVQVEAQ